MKTFKHISIASDGSLRLSQNVEVSLNNRFVQFQKQDDKSFLLNQKERKKSIESKHSSKYKKKYLKG